MSAATAQVWPKADFSRIPYEVFSDPDIWAREVARIFKGPVWNYLALEAEVPKFGDYVVAQVGDAKVVVIRARDGSLNAFENTCAHRGAELLAQPRGTARVVVCPYHLWSYNPAGDLIGVPLEEGLNGRGGMPECFDKKDHGLKKLRVATYGGLVFGTYSAATEPLPDYLGPHARAQIERLLVQRKPKVLGYLRQRIKANWKLYNENVRDPYHASLLHLFQVSFGIQAPNMQGGIKLDKDGKNTWNHSILTEQTAASTASMEKAYAGTGKLQTDLKMADPALIQVPLDLADGYKTTLLSIFPTLVVAQVDNTYAIRQIRPKAPGLFELHLTYLGFEGDTPAMTHDKLLTANMVGPAGYISMEDGEALRLVQAGIERRRGEHSVLEMGGVAPPADTDYLSQEISIRAFWRHYHKLMGFALAEAA
jgi:anthranilate 1,2-dioxygenase large subunit